MYIMTLFIIAPDEKQPKCLPTGEWLNKFYNHTVEYQVDEERISSWNRLRLVWERGWV